MYFVHGEFDAERFSYVYVYIKRAMRYIDEEWSILDIRIHIYGSLW